MEIAAFSGKYRFLSNFYPAHIEYAGATYPSVEHAFQAAKCINPIDRERIALAKSPAAAKRLGRAAAIRNDWNTIKVEIMTQLVMQKFTVHNDLAKLLLDTGDARLVEGNTWDDRFWGQCPLGIGENHLGRILMDVRDSLR